MDSNMPAALVLDALIITLGPINMEFPTTCPTAILQVTWTLCQWVTNQLDASCEDTPYSPQTVPPSLRYPIQYWSQGIKWSREGFYTVTRGNPLHVPRAEPSSTWPVASPSSHLYPVTIWNIARKGSCSSRIV